MSTMENEDQAQLVYPNTLDILHHPSTYSGFKLVTKSFPSKDKPVMVQNQLTSHAYVTSGREI